MRMFIWPVVALVGLLASGQSPADRKDWIQLFNGKNLDGWKVKITGYDLGDNFGNTFRVEDGVLKAQRTRIHLPLTRLGEAEWH